MTRYLTFICLCVTFICSNAQTDPCKPPPRKTATKPCKVDTLNYKPGKVSFRREYYRQFQFNGINFKHLSDTHKPLNIQINSVVKEKVLFRKKHHELALEVYDESSFSVFVDSLTEWERDALRITLKSKSGSDENHVNFSNRASLESMKFNKFRLSFDSLGKPIKLKEAAFLAPGNFKIQSGLLFKLNDKNEIDFGLIAGKLTWVRLKSLYESLQTEEINGVRKGMPYLLEGGLSMQSRFASSDNKKVIWEQTCRIFYPIQKEQNTEMEMLNKLSVDLNDGIKTSLISRYSYNENRWPPSQWETELRIGYEFNN